MARLKWTQFEVVMGRIVAINTRYNQTRTASSGDGETSLREVMTLSVNGGIPSLRYERRDELQHLSIEIINGDQLEIHREPRGTSSIAALHFSQPSSGELALTVDHDGRTSEVSGVNFWHLMIAANGPDAAELAAALEYLRPGWRMVERSRAVEDALFRLSDSGRLPPKKKTLRLVRMLRSSSFKTRQAANHDLREMGLSVLSILDDLDPLQLDAEQRSRLTEIRRAIVAEMDDTPARVASWMIQNKPIWLSLLSHPDAERRIAAYEHLSRIHSGAIQFDPTAAEADRRAQLELLVARLSER